MFQAFGPLRKVVRESVQEIFWAGFWQGATVASLAWLVVIVLGLLVARGSNKR